MKHRMIFCTISEKLNQIREEIVKTQVVDLKFNRNNFRIKQKSTEIIFLLQKNCLYLSKTVYI